MSVMFFLTDYNVGSYLTSYDALKLHSYLETIIAANTTTASGAVRQHQSPWLFTDAANIIFQVAKRRCFTVSSPSKTQTTPHVINLDDDDAWEAIDELAMETTGKSEGKKRQTEHEARPFWIPEGMEPELEELPKWTLVAEILKEIDEEILRQESLGGNRPACTISISM